MQELRLTWFTTKSNYSDFVHITDPNAEELSAEDKEAILFETLKHAEKLVKTKAFERWRERREQFSV